MILPRGVTRHALTALAALAGLVAASCGTTAEPDAGQPSRPAVTFPSLDSPAAGSIPPPPATTGASILPAVEVVEVATGRTVDLSTLAPASRPVLLWFWAPH